MEQVVHFLLQAEPHAVSKKSAAFHSLVQEELE
jgi:hypothetical protein